MASLVRLARRHLLRDHGHRERKRDKGRRGKWGNSPSGKEKWCFTPRSSRRRDTSGYEQEVYIYIYIYPVTSRKVGRRKETEAASISARKAWAKLPLISENTRRISGLIRWQLTAPIKSSGFAPARWSPGKKQKTGRRTNS